MSLRALFIPPLFSALTLACSSGDAVLEVQPDGAGRVYSASVDHDTLGIDCRSDGKTRRGACVKELALVDSYTLVAEAAPGATFDHWEVEPAPSAPFDATNPQLTFTVEKGVTTHRVQAFFR